MIVFYALAVLCVVVIALDELGVRRRAKTKTDRRILWNETDSRIRQRMGEKWTPEQSAKGPWSIHKGELGKESKDER